MFLSTPILIQPVPGMNSFLCPLLVSNFKLGLELFYDGCASHRNAVIIQTILGLDLRLVNFRPRLGTLLAPEPNDQFQSETSVPSHSSW